MHSNKKPVAGQLDVSSQTTAEKKTRSFDRPKIWVFEMSNVEILHYARARVISTLLFACSLLPFNRDEVFCLSPFVSCKRSDKTKKKCAHTHPMHVISVHAYISHFVSRTHLLTTHLEKVVIVNARAKWKKNHITCT